MDTVLPAEFFQQLVLCQITLVIITPYLFVRRSYLQFVFTIGNPVVTGGGQVLFDRVADIDQHNVIIARDAGEVSKCFFIHVMEIADHKDQAAGVGDFL